MTSNEYLIAFDVGGTKTDAVLFSPDGTVAKHYIGPGANTLECGLDKACGIYRDVVERLSAGLEGRLRSVYGGIASAAYFGTAVQDRMRETLSADFVRMEADGPCLISAMLGHRDGAGVICGTGSSITVRRGDEYHSKGGWGPVFDGKGGAFDLARNAIYAALRAHDGRGEQTVLTELLQDAFGEPVQNHLPVLYAKGRPYIASFARYVFQARKMGDPVACAVFDEGIRIMNELLIAGAKEFDAPFTAVLNGGVFTHFPEYTQALREAAPEKACLMMSDVPPVFGCAVEAMYSVGIRTDAAFKRRFTDTLAV